MDKNRREWLSHVEPDSNIHLWFIKQGLKKKKNDRSEDKPPFF
jgi:hypothetical protein